MGRTFQNVGLVKGSTVRENLLTAQHLQARVRHRSPGWSARPAAFAAERELAPPGRRPRSRSSASATSPTPRSPGLPYGDLKRVEIATVLATDPEVLLLDEPSSGMGPEEAARSSATRCSSCAGSSACRS